MARDFDHRASGGGRVDADGGSWLRARGLSRPFEAGPLLWPLAGVGVARVPGLPSSRDGACPRADRSSTWISNRAVSIALARREAAGCPRIDDDDVET